MKSNKRKKTVAKKHPTIITYVSDDSMYVCTPETEQVVIDNYITPDCLPEFMRYESMTPGICSYTFLRRIHVREATMPQHEQFREAALKKLRKKLTPAQSKAIAVRAGIIDKDGNLTEKYR